MTRSLLFGSVAAVALVGALSLTSPAMAQDTFAPRRTVVVDPDAYVALNTVDPNNIRGATVQVASGDDVGTVQDVSLSNDGMVDRVKIALDDGGYAWVPETSLRYNQNDEVLLTNMTRRELSRMSYREDYAY